MSCFSVCYQLNNKKDYPKLWEELERLNGHRAMNSAWFIDCNLKTNKAVRQHLEKFVDGDDMLVVAKLRERPSTRRCKHGTTPWLNARFGPEV